MSMVHSLLLIHHLVVFLIISIVNTIISIKLPISFFHYDNWFFRGWGWEKNGQIYQDYIGVKKWKNRLPELSDFLSFLFTKRQMKQSGSEYLYRFVLETCRAELVHWSIIICSFIYAQRHYANVSIVIIVIAVALNLPYIIIQRYNRPRILRLLVNKKTTIKQVTINDLTTIHKDM